jgi:molybdate transport system ATP-binding protein
MIKLSLQKQLQGSIGAMNIEVDLEIKEHDFVALSGRSGSGKTTLLRSLAGLEEAQGEIRVGDVLWQNETFRMPTQKREIGFVFQEYALFTNMSVLQNLLFVAKDKKLALHLLELTELTQLQNRLPNTLSGGQKQRVALCRALMKRPKILLMDEPLSALDLEMRNKLQHDILALHKEFGTTTIMVSHDPSEMYRLANRVVLLSHGKIVQDGTPKELLLQTKGSQKFSLSGELLDIIKADVIFIAIVAIGQQIVEVVMDEEEARSFTIGQRVQVNTKAFSPSLSS